MFWSARLFAFYLLALGCVPCTDSEHSGHSQQASLSFQSADAQNDEHHACNDLCSPLCTCACCGCVTISVKLPIWEAALEKPLVKEKQTAFSYQAPHSAAHLAALFRPPLPSLG